MNTSETNNNSATPAKGDSFEALLDMLDGGDEQTRAMIATAFAKVRDERVIDPLIQLLFDSSAQVRSLAARSLGAQGDERALWALIDQAHNMEDDVLRANCIAALAQLAHPDSFNTVVAALFDLNDGVRANAAFAAGKLADARAVEPLVMLLSDDDPRVRANAARALGEIGDESAVDGLLVVLDAELDANARSSEFLALGAIGSAAAVGRVVGEVLDSDATPNSRIAAILAAADASTAGKAPEVAGQIAGTLMYLVAHAEDDELRATSAWALGHLGLAGDDAVDAAALLESALSDPYRWVAAYAIESLAILRAASSEAALRAYAAASDDAELASLASQAADIVAGKSEMPVAPPSGADDSGESVAR